jgi:hypothetical protein
MSSSFDDEAPCSRRYAPEPQEVGLMSYGRTIYFPVCIPTDWQAR